jgi:anti-anti-sigma regulatory factor
MNLDNHQIQGQVPVTILTIEGKLDGSNYQQVIEKAKELYQTGTRSLLLDLTNMSYMSSSGIVALHIIAVLLNTGIMPDQDDGWSALHNVKEEKGSFRKEMKLLNPQERVDRTLEMSGMKQFFEIFTDLPTAVNSFT